MLRRVGRLYHDLCRQLFRHFSLLGAAAGAAGLRSCRRLLALLLFRLRDAYFSISTWVFSEIVAVLILMLPGLGHVTGMTLETARGIDFETFLMANFWIAAAIAGGAALGIYLLMRSPLGLGMISVRDNEIAATSIGVNVWRNRFIAYVAAAAGCGLAGGISFMAALFITVTTAFDLNWVVAMIFIVIIGGIGTIEGRSSAPSFITASASCSLTCSPSPAAGI